MSTVLVVEDDADVLKLLVAALQREGYNVVTAENGREALEHLGRSDPPALILLDLDMPVMDGWTFRHEQLKDPALAKIPTVLLTASSDNYKSVKDLPGVSIFPKPFDMPRLLETIASLCSKGG